jgi:hypothetical protein
MGSIVRVITNYALVNGFLKAEDLPPTDTWDKFAEPFEFQYLGPAGFKLQCKELEILLVVPDAHVH